jgi:hypothetical protein
MIRGPCGQLVHRGPWSWERQRRTLGCRSSIKSAQRLAGAHREVSGRERAMTASSPATKVVIIGLELLGLACPSLGLGSGYVHQLCLCHTIMVMVFDTISVENRIWGDGNGTCRCDAYGSRLLSGAMLEAYG